MTADISVIVPVYKAEAYLRPCLDSILAQDLERFELILVDDGSPDGSGAICDAYAARDGRIRVIHQENTGQATARNRAARLSQGAFITFVDADDRISPGYLTALYAAAESAGADIAVARICLEFPRRDGSASQRFYPLPKSLSMDRDTALEALCREQVSGISGLLCGKLIRRQIFLDHPFPDGKLFEDSFALWRQFADCRLTVCVPEAVYYYLQRPGSTQHKAFEPRHMDLIDAVTEMMDEFQAAGMPPAVIRAGAYKVCRSCYVTAYHAADLPLDGYRQVYGRLAPLLRQYYPAARDQLCRGLKERVLFCLLRSGPTLFYALVKLAGLAGEGGR